MNEQAAKQNVVNEISSPEVIQMFEQNVDRKKPPYFLRIEAC